MTAQTKDLTRTLPFEVQRAVEDGDGLTMTGYAAVFNQPARIDSWEGKFDEVIRPGAFAESLSRQTPVLMFDHGQHPLIGSIPIGRFTDVHEDANGLHVEARFHNNWLTEPIRDAIRERSITGMSFRFRTEGLSDKWTDRAGNVPLRELLNVTVPEAGPVVFPAYAGTEVAVRSGEALRQMMEDDGCVEPGDDDEDIVEALLNGAKEQLGELAGALAIAQSPALVAWLNEEFTDTLADINELSALGMQFAGEEDEPRSQTVTFGGETGGAYKGATFTVGQVLTGRSGAGAPGGGDATPDPERSAPDPESAARYRRLQVLTGVIK